MKTLAAVLLIVLLGTTEPSLAQGCALCKSAVASQVAKAIEAINTGIVLLLVPPVGMMSAILFVAFRRRDRNDRP